jgi:hypothetical protein
MLVEYLFFKESDGKDSLQTPDKALILSFTGETDEDIGDKDLGVL